MIAESLRPPPVHSIVKPQALSGETIYCNTNWRRVEPTLSVLVPVYHHDPCALINGLNACGFAHQVELVLYDDGTNDTELTVLIRHAIEAFSGAACLVTADQNKGRSAGRNRLEQIARSDWLLFLDADMLPDDGDFLARYLKSIEKHNQPMLVVGGFSLNQVEVSAKTRLHWQQCETSECLPAQERRTNPGRFVFTSNVLVHKDIMTVVPFDDDFKGWGWEDVDWGLRAARRFPVFHINNTATHMGLDTPGILLGKYGKSGKNFWLAAERHPDELKGTALYKSSRFLSWIPGQVILKWISGGLARLPGWIAPVKVRLIALKLFRASAYAEAYHARKKPV